MAVKIGDLLVKNGLITEQQLDKALEAQVLHGGRLGTNLVELDFVTTDILTEFLARQLGLPALAPSQLNSIPPEALAAVDPKLAAKHMLVPVSLEKRKLRVAMADPTDLSAVDELAFRTGYQVIPIVAPEILVEYALERFYNVRRENRFVRLVGNVGGQVEDDWPGVPKSPVARPKLQVPIERYGIQEAAEELVDCTKNSDVISILKRYLLRNRKRVMIFVVDGKSLRALSQSGCVLPREVPRDGQGKPLKAIEIDLTGSVLYRAASSGQGPSLEPPHDAASDRLLLKILDPPPDTRILVFPIQIEDQVEVVAFATRERIPDDESDLETHAQFATKVSQAIQLVRLHRAILSF